MPAPTSLTHWGGFSADMESGDIASVIPLDGDTDPSPLLGNLPGAIRHRSRIATPAVRRGWLRDGPGPSTRRGADEFVAVSCDGLTEILAGELRRVVDTHVNEAIYGGSYGWASAGRFRHAQSQVHRFLKLLGGYTFSRHSYSLGATGVIMPRVVGTHGDVFKRSTAWDVIVEHTDLLVCFGGLALKNTGINSGGTTDHPARDALRRFRDRGGHIVSFSPLRDDPADPDTTCVHGNPNVLTDDVGTSSLTRGSTGSHVLVQVEKFTGPLPPVLAHEPPAIVDR